MKSFFIDFKKSGLSRIALAVNIIAFSLCCFVQNASAQDSTPKEITVHVSNTEIEDVLSLIEKQSPYRFLYNSDLKTLQQKVSVNIKGIDVKEVLNQLFINTDLTYTMMDNNLIVINKIVQNVDKKNIFAFLFER